ncbi:uncharacterized protein LOC129309939 [Prosopis cineraria]|uniref:uncharacterized protein LOC129309939 n=1 Tax=Prosopis cineraria TaxID=364024 RepID=UPI00240F1C73|nr:uncharacterized protein LOC129309939 [Prosopis cineraria]
MESELVMMRRLLALMGNEGQGQARTSNGGHNSGTQGSFTNSGSGSQQFRDVNYNNGACSGNGNVYPRYYNDGGNLIHNSGTVHGNGNGSIVYGGLDSSTRNRYW